MNPIQIQTFGGFALESGGTVISDTGNRSRKVWSLLAYLLYNRERIISQKTLIDLLWGADSGSENPENALRITLHRLRTMLDRLWPGAGRELIVHKDGGYCWNSDCPVTTDYELFEALVTAEEEQQDALLTKYLEALSLYKGEFLPKYSSEFWVIPMSTHFHNLYLQASMASAELLLSRQRQDEALSICRRAATTEPYHEPLHRLLMLTLAATGDYEGVTKVYDELSKRLSDDFGISPNEETRDTFLQSSHPPDSRAIPIDRLLAQIQDVTPEPGALLCEYNEFKTLCRARSRVMERSGDETHVVLLSLASPTDDNMARVSIAKAMMEMEVLLQKNLRRGDVIARCSASQFVVMLVDANYESSCLVCRRLLAALPKSDIKVNYMVQPLGNLNMP